MINFTDVNPTLFASDGQFFYGKLVFLSPGTTDPKQVFDKDGVVYASNVVTTDTHGRMEIQVFLDGAYDVQFWKFVGTQFDIDDPTQWAFDREMRVLDPTKVTLEISGDAIVGTVDDLRGVDNAAEGASMTVMGYYAAGDMTPQYYYWNPNVADNDDGGSVICPEGRTGAGRWLMIPQRVVDVRAFGVKPSQQANTATVTGNMAGAFNFANRYNRDLWFPKVYSSAQYSQQVYSYYAFNGGNMQLPNNYLLIDNCVRFLAVSGNTVLNVKDISKKDELFVDNENGSFSVASDSLHFVWDGSNVAWNPRKSVVLDANLSVSRSKTWSFSNLDVVMVDTCPSTYSFTNCRFSGPGKLPLPADGQTQSFTSCMFRDRLYNNSDTSLAIYKSILDGKLSLSNCIIEDVDRFDLPVNYLVAVLKNGGAGDERTLNFNGKTVVSYGFPQDFQKISLSKINVREGIFGNTIFMAVCDNTVSFCFEYCKFTVSPIPLNNENFYPSVDFVGCTISGPSGDSLIVANGGSSSITNSVVNVEVGGLGSLEARDTKFQKEFSFSNSENASLSFTACVFLDKVEISGRLSNGETVIENVYIKECRLLDSLVLKEAKDLNNQSYPIHLKGLFLTDNFFANASKSVEVKNYLGNEGRFTDDYQEYRYEGNYGAKAPNNDYSGSIELKARLNDWLTRHTENDLCTIEIKSFLPGSQVDPPYVETPTIKVFALGKRKFAYSLKGWLKYSVERRYPFVLRAVFEVDGKGYVEQKAPQVRGSVVTDFLSSNAPGIADYVTYMNVFWLGTTYTSDTPLTVDKDPMVFEVSEVVDAQ